jgi:hypothetical protein
MTVDVTWDGVALVRGATIREQDGGWFVELEQPMPVGTSVVISGDVQATATVSRVTEGAGAGMLMHAGGARSADPEPPAAAGDKEEKKEKRNKKKR